jgi:hypothetical protein
VQPAPVTRSRRPVVRAQETLQVRCTPWCVPFVDGRASGPDGKDHRISVAAGRHRITAQRLDDRQERTVEVRAGEPQVVEFTFP